MFHVSLEGGWYLVLRGITVLGRQNTFQLSLQNSFSCVYLEMTTVKHNLGRCNILYSLVNGRILVFVFSLGSEEGTGCRGDRWWSKDRKRNIVVILLYQY